MGTIEPYHIFDDDLALLSRDVPDRHMSSSADLRIPNSMFIPPTSNLSAGMKVCTLGNHLVTFVITFSFAGPAGTHRREVFIGIEAQQ